MVTLPSENLGTQQQNRPYKRLGVNRSRGQLRSELIDAAREILRDGSYEKLTMEQIAAKATISRRTLYNLFQDKDDVYRQTCEHLIKTVGDLMVDEIPERMSAIDGMRFYVESCMEIYSNAATKDLLRIVVRDGAQHPWIAKAYSRQIRSPLIRVCELFVLKKSRRTPMTNGAPYHVGAQVADIVKFQVLGPLIFGLDNVSADMSTEQLNIITQAYACILDGAAQKSCSVSHEMLP
jgi:hypothetical protein